MRTWITGEYRRKRVVAVVSIILALTTCAVVVAQQVKRTRSAEIKAATMVYAWGNSTFEFAGDCQLEIHGAYQAKMSAPKMTAKLNKKGDRIEHLTAAGPVHFVLTTAPDENKVVRKIVASSQGDATYEEGSQVVVLNGGAIADVTTVPVSPDSESAHFEGDKIVANLKDKTMTVEKPHMNATYTPEEQ